MSHLGAVTRVTLVLVFSICFQAERRDTTVSKNKNIVTYSVVSSNCVLTGHVVGHAWLPSFSGSKRMSHQGPRGSIPYRPSTRAHTADNGIRTIERNLDMENEYSDVYISNRARISPANGATREQGQRPRSRGPLSSEVGTMAGAKVSMMKQNCEEDENCLLEEDEQSLPSGEARDSLGVTATFKGMVEDSPNTYNNEEHVMFSCNICHELASEPVVTLCGHLYCWPCLYRWLQMRSNLRTCPVCKAGVDRDKVIPVYGRGGNGDPRLKKMDEVPLRPSGQRPIPVDTRGIYVGASQHTMQLPNLFGLTSGTGRYHDYVSPEQQHQAFLSRLLLMLGSFVIMCLLLF